ncbi:hypothetical protein KPP23_004 [Pseudomonas phage KPP23]|nr:tail assembly structural protein [Pseudomonas phage RSP]BAO53031.1 hypothetical protein KPP23_004 [Pseudomonas phage KPP23]
MSIIPYLVIMVVMLVLAVVLAPKPTTPKPAIVEDIDMPTAEQGKPIKVIFGTILDESPNCVWYGDPAYTPIKTKSGK